MVSAEDWIHAAARRLASDGVGAVRVELLARDLEVSKGSFYWHFANRDALLERVLDHWRRAGVDAVVDHVEATTHDPGARLRALLERAFGHRDHGFDVAVRAWATHDERARTAARAVDVARTAYLVRLLTAAGALEPRGRAEVVYRTLLGEYAARHTGSPPLAASAVAGLVEWALTSAPDAGVADSEGR